LLILDCMTSRFAFPIAVVAFVLIGFVVPLVRMRLRTGHSGLVRSHDADALQPIVATSLGALFAGALLLGALHAGLGPEAVGVWPVPSWLMSAGAVAAAMGTAVMSLAQVQMRDSWRIGIDRRSETALVTHGLYGRIRNPIFSGLFLALAGAVVLAPSAWSIMGALLIVQTIVIQVRAEERHLLARHGEAYARYASGVGRFVPGLGKLQPDGR
jgi:protein-S-isoprenylcysteine O-methyltransferase Ste14